MNRQILLSNIKKTVSSDYPKSKILLYGSRSRGDASRYWDWDILIVVDKELSDRRKIDIHNKIL